MLYEFAAREIEASFLEARRRLGPRQSASDVAHLVVPFAQGNDGGAEHADVGTDVPELRGPAPHMPSRAADLPTGLVANLNLVDPSPRRRSVSR
jgi:hypothetical protein